MYVQNVLLRGFWFLVVCIAVHTWLVLMVRTVFWGSRRKERRRVETHLPGWGRKEEE